MAGERMYPILTVPDLDEVDAADAAALAEDVAHAREALAGAEPEAP